MGIGTAQIIGNDIRGIKMSYMPNRWGYVLPIEEMYWNRFCRSNKAGIRVHAYVQAGSAISSNIKLIFFYSVRPHREILGYAEVLNRIEGNSSELWNSLGRETCLYSYDEYLKLIREKEKATFIRFENLYEAPNAISFDSASAILRTERMSQIGMYVDKEQADKLVELLKQENSF